LAKNCHPKKLRRHVLSAELKWSLLVSRQFCSEGRTRISHSHARSAVLPKSSRSSEVDNPSRLSHAIYRGEFSADALAILDASQSSAEPPADDMIDALILTAEQILAAVGHRVPAGSACGRLSLPSRLASEPCSTGSSNVNLVFDSFTPQYFSCFCLMESLF
jgi:hypothetical protein